MKTINVTFEDEEFDELETAKGEDNWRDFILTLVTSKKKVK
jgi:predicted CopG family antitoxin